MFVWIWKRNDAPPSTSTDDTDTSTVYMFPSISTEDTLPSISTEDTLPSISTEDTLPSTSTGQNEKESLPAIDVGERNEQELGDFVLERFSLKRPRPALTNRSATLRWDPEKNTIKVYMDVLGLMREHMNPDAQLFDAKMFMQDSLTLPAFEDLKDALVDPSNPVKEEIFLDELGVARIKEVSIEEDNAGTQEVSIEQANVGMQEVLIEQDCGGIQEVSIEQDVGTHEVPIHEDNVGTHEVPIDEDNAATQEVPIEQDNAGTQEVPIEQDNAGTQEVHIEQDNAGNQEVPIEQDHAGTEEDLTELSYVIIEDEECVSEVVEAEAPVKEVRVRWKKVEESIKSELSMTEPYTFVPKCLKDLANLLPLPYQMISDA